MKTFKLTISTPQGNAFEGEVKKISLRAGNGDLAVMANHTPLISSVKPCKCSIDLADGSVKFLRLEDGLICVSSNDVNLESTNLKWL